MYRLHYKGSTWTPLGSSSGSALMGCWQLSSSSSDVPSGHGAPLNQRRPPSLWVPPFRDMVSCCSCRSWLYCGIRDLGMRKKMKSSTHLDTGPMPSDLNKSAAASARLPNTPAEDEHPNCYVLMSLVLFPDCRLITILLSRSIVCPIPNSEALRPGNSVTVSSPF